MAQLGEYTRTKELLRSATRAFGPKEAVARVTPEQHGDRLNVARARYLQIRRLLLLGRLDEAELKLADLDPSLFPSASRTAHENRACWDRHATCPNCCTLQPQLRHSRSLKRTRES